jgi:hypothetical protein
MKIFTTVLSIFLLSTILTAQVADTSKPDPWKFFGSIQIRSELDGRDFLNETYPLTYTSMRINLGASKMLFNDVFFFIQFQDSRVWGQEKNTAKNIFNIDLHQGYVTVKNIFREPLSVQAGRFEMNYGSSRLFSASNWGYVNRAFDGVRVSYSPASVTLDAFAITHTLSNDYFPGAIPAAYPYPPLPDTSMSIYGIWAKMPKIAEGHSLDLYGYTDINRRKTDGENLDIDRYTTGLNYNGNIGDMRIFGEFNYQFGQLRGLDISAYSLWVILEYKFDPLTIGLNADLHSGTPYDETEKTGLFQSPYGTKHIFIGFMDYFTILPVSTLNLGLNDYFLEFKYKQKDSPFSGLLQCHYFQTPNEAKTGESNLGIETDLVLTYEIVKGATIEWGGSIFLPDQLMKDIYTVNPGTPDEVVRGDMSFWSYLMLRAAIN